jgi:hypothetical protein
MLFELERMMFIVMDFRRGKTPSQTSLGDIHITDEPWIHRLIPHNVSGREDAFHQGVRSRDGKCVISGVVNTSNYRGSWIGFEAAHIFPLENPGNKPALQRVDL